MKRFRTIIIYVIGAFLLFSLVKNLIDYRGKLSFYNSFKKEYEDEKKKDGGSYERYTLFYIKFNWKLLISSEQLNSITHRSIVTLFDNDVATWSGTAKRQSRLG